MKYDNKSYYPVNWTTQKLKNEFLQLDESIHHIGCFGRNDLVLFYTIEDELTSRGIEIERKSYFKNEDEKNSEIKEQINDAKWGKSN